MVPQDPGSIASFVFVGDQGAANAAAYIAGPLTALYRNATSKFTLEGITLSIDAEETTRTAVIERAWVDDATVTPGRDVALHVVVRTSTGPGTPSTSERSSCRQNRSCVSSSTGIDACITSVR